MYIIANQLPRYKEGTTDYQNMFAITKSRSIGLGLSIYFADTGAKNIVCDADHFVKLTNVLLCLIVDSLIGGASMTLLKIAADARGTRQVYVNKSDLTRVVSVNSPR